MEHPNLGVEVYGKSCQHDQARVRVLRLCKKRLYVIRQNLILFYSIGWEDKQKDDTETFRSATLVSKLVSSNTTYSLQTRFLQTPLIRYKNSSLNTTDQL